MSVTSSVGNVLTLIYENGSEPSGSGGGIIDNNFRKIDSMLSGSGGNIYIQNAQNALYANYANSASSANFASGAYYANYAYSCAGSGGSTGVPDFAKATGFMYPTSSYGYTVSDTYPYAIWGSQYSTAFNGSYVSGTSSFTGIPPFGPFMCRLQICLHNYYNDSRAFAEALICGWNCSISFVKMLHCYDESGTEITASDYSISYCENIYSASVDASKEVDLIFALNSNQIYCAGFKKHAQSEQTLTYVYITAVSLYSGTVSGTQGYSSYYCS